MEFGGVAVENLLAADFEVAQYTSPEIVRSCGTRGWSVGVEPPRQTHLQPLVPQERSFPSGCDVPCGGGTLTP